MINNPPKVSAPYGAAKGADQTVNNSAVLVDITGLGLAVGINEVWKGVLGLLHISSGVADIKIGFTVPAGGACHFCSAGMIGQLASNAVLAMITGANTLQLDGIGANRETYIYFHYIGGAAGGTLQPQFAQQTQNVSDATIQENSYISALKVAG